jgi:hypothetical protein
MVVLGQQGANHLWYVYNKEHTSLGKAVVQAIKVQAIAAIRFDGEVVCT